MQHEGGCYGDCYAAKSAKLYGYDFSKTVLRDFESEAHKRKILAGINKIKLPFVRIGCSGDPSENWEHCFKILKTVAMCNKEIVIITKHWTLLNAEQLKQLSLMNICINTSVSALDNPDQLSKCLEQYRLIKQYCKSILRIVSCDFNLDNETGFQLAMIQKSLFQNESTLDTVFRPSKNSPYITDGIINVSKGKFNGNIQLMSKHSRKTYTGKCSTCHEMCGVTIKTDDHYPEKPGIIKQLKLL